MMMTDNEWIFRGGGVHRSKNAKRLPVAFTEVRSLRISSLFVTSSGNLIKDSSMERSYRHKGDAFSSDERDHSNRATIRLVGGLFWTDRSLPIVCNLVWVMQKSERRGSVESKIGSLQARIHPNERAINYRAARDWDRLRQPREFTLNEGEERARRKYTREDKRLW